jgi:hypothetical protein
MVVITGSGSDWLLGETASAGLPVIIEPSLRAPIDLRSNARRHVAAAAKAGPPCAGSACRGHRGRRGEPADLSEGSRGLYGCWPNSAVAM